MKKRNGLLILLNWPFLVCRVLTNTFGLVPRKMTHEEAPSAIKRDREKGMMMKREVLEPGPRGKWKKNW